MKNGNKVEKKTRKIAKKAVKKAIKQSKKEISRVKKRPMPKVGRNACKEPYLRYAAAIANPGSIDAPFIDADHVCPQSHGVVHGKYTETIDNTKYLIITLAPSFTSATAVSLTDLKCGFTLHKKAPANMGDTVGLGLGNTDTWTSIFGGTTAASRIFCWAQRLELTILVPSAVVQGEVFIGNLPASTVATSTFQQLITFAERLELNADRKHHTLKCSITERDLVHQPYGSYDVSATNPTYPLDERVSYIIFSPAVAGTIAGSVPTEWNVDVNAYANYTWVPVPQPMVTSIVNAGVKGDTSRAMGATAEDQKATGDVTGSQSTNPQPDRDFKNMDEQQWEQYFHETEDKIGKVHGSHQTGFFETAWVKKLKYAISNAHSTAEALGLFRSYTNRNRMHAIGAANDAPGLHQAINLIPDYSTQVEDLKFFLARINIAWGDYARYLPQEVADGTTSLVMAMGSLINKMTETTQEFRGVRRKFLENRQEFYRAGKRCEEYYVDGVSLTDWFGDLKQSRKMPRIRPKSSDSTRGSDYQFLEVRK